MPARENIRRFQFLREIASGGFGSVFLTKVMHSDGFSRIAAVKLLHRRWSENEEIARRMRDEARLLGWLRHRNIVDVVDLTSLDGRAAIIMEYLEAADLKTIVRRSAEEERTIPVRACLEVLACVASALDAAFNRPPYPGEKPLRVIHRDIKPSNVMVDDSGLVKVLDFGVARAEFDARESDTRELQFGSIDYMPPERLLFEQETPGSDVYSLGSTCFELMTLEKLGKAQGVPEKHARFVADRLSYLRAFSGLSGPAAGEVEELLGSCLAYGAEQRPSAADLVGLARKLARGLEGPTLAEWAEIHVPNLVESTRQAKENYNPMVSKVLTEDRVLFGVEEDEQVSTQPEPPTLDELPAIETGSKEEAPEEEEEDTQEEVSDAWEEAPTRLAPPEELKRLRQAEEDAEEAAEAAEAAEQDGGTVEIELGTEKEVGSVDEEGGGASTLVSTPAGASGLDPSMALTIPGVKEEIQDAATRIHGEDEGNVPEFVAEEGTIVMDEDEVSIPTNPGEQFLSAEDSLSGSKPLAPFPTTQEPTLVMPEEQAVGDLPPLSVEDASPMGAETVLAPVDSDCIQLDSEPTSLGRRLFASTLIFLIFLLVSGGIGAFVFRAELFGEGGLLSFLVQEEEPTDPGPEVTQPEREEEDAPPLEVEDPLADYDGSTLAFESMSEGTRKLVVDCTGASGSGVKAVVLEVESADSCLVSAHVDDERLRAVLTNLGPGKYSCFGDDPSGCSGP